MSARSIEASLIRTFSLTIIPFCITALGIAFIIFWIEDASLVACIAFTVLSENRAGSACYFYVALPAIALLAFRTRSKFAAAYLVAHSVFAVVNIFRFAR